MQDSVFTKIIKGEIPSHKIYEDDRTLAFLDIHPLQPGMTLIISKTQVENFDDLDEQDYTALWQTVRKVAKRLREYFPEHAKIAVQVEGLDVPHVHVKLFPFTTSDQYHALAPDIEPDHAALAFLAEKLQITGKEL